MKRISLETNEFYNKSFFGYGEAGDFKYFSLAHIMPILLLIIAIILVYINRDKIKKSKHENTIRLLIGFIGLMSEFAFFWRLLYTGVGGNFEGQKLLTRLPIQVCDWTCIIASIMMFNKNEDLFDMVFFVALTVGVIPLVTPAVISTTGPTYFRYYQYWINHLFTIFSVFYLLFVHNFKPKRIGIVYSLIFYGLLGLIAIYANNHIPNAAFFYLNTQISLAKFLPDGQLLRLVIMMVLFTIVTNLLYKLYVILTKNK